MAIRPNIILGFHGMNNLPTPPSKLVDENRLNTPRLILNADVMDSGLVNQRGGYRLQVSLPGAHSLWAGSVMLAVAAGILNRIEGTMVTPLATVSGPRAPLSYAEVNNLVYVSSPSWNGVYELLTDTMRPWGLDPPGAPDISLIPGDLAPGRYSLAYTKFVDGRLSGNGPLTQIVWEGQAQGIQLNNLGADELCWITHPNGSDLFLAMVDGQGQIIGQVPNLQPLLTLGVIPPPPFAHFAQAHGRIWGANGRNLYYSEPGEYEWFKRKNYLPFLENLVMVAPFADGLYVHSRKSCWCLTGTDPGKMTVKRVGDGAVPGTLTFAMVEGGGYEISKTLSQMPSPIWMGEEGFIVGTHSGHVVHLTDTRLKIASRECGAAITRDLDGVPQILISQSGQSDDVDPELAEIFNMNRLCLQEAMEITFDGGALAGGTIF
jgi:hypothetical protein